MAAVRPDASIPVTGRSFDSIAPSYDASRGGEERGRRFAASIGSFLDPSEPVVEIGVGTGLVAAGLAEMGFAVAGIDLSLPMLRVASARLGGRIAGGDATRLPLASGRIAQACSVWLLHLAPAAAVLGEAARVLRPDGRYVVVSSVVGPAGGGDDAGAVLDALMRRLDPDWAGGKLDGLEAISALAPAAGLVVESSRLIENPYTQTPMDLVRRIEQRAYSRLVDLGDERWREVVVPAIEALEGLPEPDRPRRGVAHHDLIVLRPSR